MKTFFTRFFVTLGVIFFILICAGAYIWFADPFQIRPLVNMLWGHPAAQTTPVPGGDTGAIPATSDTPATTGTTGTSASPAPSGMTTDQASALKNIGIDPTTFVQNLTPTQLVCFTEKLGAARVAEIKAGAVPSASEVLTARACL